MVGFWSRGLGFGFEGGDVMRWWCFGRGVGWDGGERVCKRGIMKRGAEGNRQG